MKRINKLFAVIVLSAGLGTTCISANAQWRHGGGCCHYFLGRWCV